MDSTGILRGGRTFLLFLGCLLGGGQPSWAVPAQHTEPTDSLSPEQEKLLRTARNLHNQSRHHYDYGRYASAIATLDEAIGIIESIKGHDDPLVTLFLNDKAFYYQAKRELGSVEKLFREVLARREKAFGAESIQTLAAKENLADALDARGLAGGADSLYQQVRITLEQGSLGGRGQNQLSRIRAKLGRASASNGQLSTAEEHYKAALSISEALHGEGHIATGPRLNDLALFYTSRAGRHVEAQAMFKRLLAMIEPELGPSGEVWTAKQNLGMSYLRSGNYGEAELLLKERYDFQRGDPFLEQMGSPKLAVSASNLGELYWAMGKMDQALPLWREAGERYARHENATLAVGSENERLLYAAGLIDNVNATISMHLFGAPKNHVAAEVALTRILRTKGRVIEAQADTFRAVREGLTPDHRAMIQQLGKLRGALAFLVLSGGSPGEQADLEKEIGQIEEEFADQSAELTDINRLVTLEDVRAALPEKAALVEFVRYQPFDVRKRSHAAPRYAAYVLRKNGAVVGVDLGRSRGIDQSVANFRLKLSNRAPLTNDSQALYQALIEPWAKVVAEETHLVLAPDSQLNLLPFEALAAENGEFLIESHQVTYLVTGRELLRLQGFDPSTKPPIIIANPEYGSGQGRSTETETGPLAGLVWENLPGTAAEAKIVGELFEGAVILAGGAATEERLKAVSAPSILHLATHGFFLAPSGHGAAQAARGLVVTGEHAKEELRETWTKMDNPLLRSGLVLAGANNRPRDNEQADGYLTALEATGLDLHGTQLVVMSACETGVGEVTSGQGVFGLRRAIDLAGAQSQVMSLWQVSDEATTELMRRFYGGLSAGQSRAVALRKARLALANSERWSHPYYWSAFILSGAWGKLR